MKFSRVWMVVILGVLQGTALQAQVTYEPYAFSLLAGSAGSLGSNDGTGSAAQFNAPQGAAVDGNGNVYIADTGNNTIRKITPLGVVTTFAGFAGSAGSNDGTGSAARFELPQGVAVDTTGNVYVGDSQNYTIRKITPAGVVSTLAGAAHEFGSTDGARLWSQTQPQHATNTQTAENRNVAAADASHTAALQSSPGQTLVVP
jgi:streptogramin lyase